MKKNLIVFGIRNKSGGGKVVLKAVEEIFKDDANTIILNPGHFGWLEKIPLFVELYFDLIFRTSKDYIVLNLGDIPLKTKYKQIYYFDWMFLCLQPSELIGFGLKRFLKFLIINHLSKYVTVCLAQSYTTKRALENLRLFGQIKIGYTPIPKLGLVNEKLKRLIPKNINQGFIYPSNFAKHKRFDRIIEFAKSCPDQLIFLTLSDTEFKKSRTNSCQNILNLGILNHDLLITVLQKSKGLIFPSSLESFGIPIVEAAALNKPILYWDQDFVLELAENPIRKDEFIMTKMVRNSKLNSKVYENLSNKENFKKLLYENMY